MTASERDALLARVYRCIEAGFPARIDDTFSLLYEVERLREDAARLDWLEQNAGRVSGPADDSPRFVIWGDTDATDATGDTLRAAIDAAMTGGPNAVCKVCGKSGEYCPCKEAPDA